MALQMTLFPMDSHYLDSINTLTWLSLLELQTIEKITPQQYLGEGPGVSRLVKVTSQPLLNWSKIFYCLSRGAKNAHCSICEIFWSKDQHSRFGKWVFSSFQDNFIHYIWMITWIKHFGQSQRLNAYLCFGQILSVNNEIFEVMQH